MMNVFEGEALGGPWAGKVIARPKRSFEVFFTPVKKPGQQEQEPARLMGRYTYVVNHWKWEQAK